MKKITAISSTVIVLLMLAGCNSNQANPELTYTNTFYNVTTINENLEEIKSDYPIESFIAPDGKPIMISSASNAGGELGKAGLFVLIVLTFPTLHHFMKLVWTMVL